MSDLRDQAIRLFGRDILLPDECHNPDGMHHLFHIPPESRHLEKSNDFRSELGDLPDKDLREPSSPYILEECQEFPTSKEENDTSLSKRYEEEHRVKSNPATHIPNKPNTVLACPRCDSLKTKFCYYNNYNVNQPRHFCKNCHRYWTAGGTMRKVPVGARKRKSKHLP